MVSKSPVSRFWGWLKALIVPPAPEPWIGWEEGHMADESRAVAVKEPRPVPKALKPKVLTKPKRTPKASTPKTKTAGKVEKAGSRSKITRKPKGKSK